ncbi:hypothetical protein RJT34_10920 [Clitoria ternatea]|uniref:Uncharacterized protein n=1 Tax=Clitoria ternatea TaxID=43366 RepID=A0AAN9JJ20_CLITE
MEKCTLLLSARHGPTISLTKLILWKSHSNNDQPILKARHTTHHDRTKSNRSKNKPLVSEFASALIFDDGKSTILLLLRCVSELYRTRHSPHLHGSSL